MLSSVTLHDPTTEQILRAMDFLLDDSPRLSGRRREREQIEALYRRAEAETAGECRVGRCLVGWDEPDATGLTPFVVRRAVPASRDAAPRGWDCIEAGHESA